MNPTASGLFRAHNCTASCALPQVSTGSDAAAKGTSGHSYLEQLGAGVDTEKALEKIPAPHRDMCERIEVDGLPLGPGYLQEVTFAFDVSTGRARHLGNGLGRQYPPTSPTEIVGTLDVVGKAEGKVIVEDYKFDGYESHSPEPEENPQLFFGALCLARLDPSISSIEVALRHFRPDGSHWREKAEVDAFDLDIFAGQLRVLLDRIRVSEDLVFAGKTPPVSRGPWCRFCPAVTSCPPILDMVRAAAHDPAAPAEQIRDLLQDAGAGDLASRKQAASLALRRLKEVEDALKPWKSAIYLFASEQPIDLGDGRVYGTVDRPIDELDARKTRTVLAQMFGPEVAEAGCDFETSKAQIERAVKPLWTKRAAEWKEAKGQGLTKDKKPTLTGLKEAVLVELAKAGGVNRVVKRQVRLHRVAATGEVELLASGTDEDTPF